MRYKIIRFQKLMWHNIMRLTKSQKVLILHYGIDRYVSIINVNALRDSIHFPLPDFLWQVTDGESSWARWVFYWLFKMAWAGNGPWGPWPWASLDPSLVLFGIYQVGILFHVPHRILRRLDSLSQRN